MKHSGATKNPAAEWTLSQNDDGTLDFSLNAKSLRVRAVRGKSRYSILKLITNLPSPLSIDGFSIHPRLVLVLSAKPSQKDLQAIRWGEIRKLSKRK